MTVISQRLVTPTHLGQLLRSARKKLNLTQAQLAKRVTHPKSISTTAASGPSWSPS